MTSAAVQRLESLLQARKLDNTLTRAQPGLVRRVLPTGIASIDVRLDGGWPQGEVSELLGRRSSGRTSVLIATLAAAAQRGGLVGFVDAFDRFDPRTAAGAGLDLDRVLWVRGTASGHVAVRQAVRALDLIVRAGGFAVAALDVADAPLRSLHALPFTTWQRIAHANEGRETVCLLVGESPMGRSARGVALRLNTTRRWAGTSAQSRRFVGFDDAVLLPRRQ